MFVWDVATGDSFRRFQGHMGKVNAVAFNSDASILASGEQRLSELRLCAACTNVTPLSLSRYHGAVVGHEVSDLWLFAEVVR